MSKNHYVSQLIIKRFSPSVDTFDMQTNRIIEHRQAHKIFCDKDIYSDSIEQKMAHDLEQPFASILDKKILHRDTIELTRKELLLVKQFLLLDSVRTYSHEEFFCVIEAFNKNAQRYLLTDLEHWDGRLKMLPTTASLNISAEELHMRAMKLYLDCQTSDDVLNHPLATLELFCWAKVVFDAYLSFWDSHDNHEFVLTSTGMVSDYEPSHIVFEGLDLSKHSYLFAQLNLDLNKSDLLFYTHCLSFNQLMYENFNIFNLSATRCMVLIHPFFKLYNDEAGAINGEKISAPMPDIWPSWVESRGICRQPTVTYKEPGRWLLEDVFEYRTVKLTEWDTIYVNQLILSQTYRLIGFHHVEKIIDSLTCITLLNALSDRALLDKLHAIENLNFMHEDLRLDSQYFKDMIFKIFSVDAVVHMLDNMVKEKYHYIFDHYQDRDLICRIDPFAYVDYYSEACFRDTKRNKYVLKFLLSDEEKVKTMPNFAFMGNPEQRIKLLKSDLERLEKRK